MKALQGVVGFFKNRKSELTSYQQMCRRRLLEHRRFTAVDLAQKFVPYYNSGVRIKVRLSTGEEVTGTVGVTTGWMPAFLLMRSKRALGSSIVLSDEDVIVAVRRGLRYEEL